MTERQQTGIEIETRCKVKNEKEFRRIFDALDTASVFPAKRGEMEELNLVYVSHVGSNGIMRLRRRIFPDGTGTYIYTEKGKNQSVMYRKKYEMNTPLTKKLFDEKLEELETRAFRHHVYERRFRLEDYRIYNGVQIELFEFPFLGWYAEFELKRGTIRNLKMAMKEFGFILEDNVQESVYRLSMQFCIAHGISFSPILVFSGPRWLIFCSERGISYTPPIRFPEDVTKT